ncbi:MAG: recombinase family protein, partial [Candidatus Hodarchaeales archaeon]
MRKLIEYVKSNGLDFVVVVKLDRLTRRLTDLQYLTDLFQKNHVNLVSINEKLDTETATGRFFITILGSLAQLEREQISERVQDVFENIAPKQPLGGYAPFGYFYLPDEKQHFPYLPEYCEKFNIPPLYLSYTDEVFYPGNYIPEIYSWYQTHESFNHIAKKLTESYIPTPLQIQRSLNDYFRNDLPNNVEISKIFISTPKKWSRQTVKNVLSNPFYA